MIILHNDKNKIYLTFLLSLIVFVGLIIVWGKFGVSSQASSKPETVVKQLGENNLLKDVQNSVELGKLQLSQLQEKIAKDQKQEELLAAAREYLNNKASTTPTSSNSLISTDQPTSTATTSIK